MSEEKKKDLEDKGLIVLNIWHTILLIAAMIIGIGLLIGTTTNRLDTVEAKTSKIEEKQEQLQNDIPKQLIEIKINLKSFLESQKFHYQEQ